MSRKLICLALLSSAASGCVTIQNGGTCAAAGKLDHGGICSRLTTADTNDLTFKEFIDLLEAQPERTCVPVKDFNICAEDQSHGTPVVLPARAAAIVMPAEDFGNLKTELESACRELGSRCSKALRQVLQNLK